MRRASRRGTVYLVGAGPGDPRLITLRGAELLREADVVVHDRLASAALLDLAAASAERVDAGKKRGRAAMTQEAINEVLVDRARAANAVVRLKGGDPFVFGRGGEEALALARAGVPLEVVPGVTSAVAAPAFAGIPVTHRDVAGSFAVVTASRARGGDEALRRAATAVDTLVVMMAAARLEATSAVLIDAGRDPREPAAVVEAASTPAQRAVFAPLREIASRAAAAGITSPATLVVGEVVALAAETAWFRAEAEHEATATRSEFRAVLR